VCVVPSGATVVVAVTDKLLSLHNHGNYLLVVVVVVVVTVVPGAGLPLCRC
jgi:hypothetical protein